MATATIEILRPVKEAQPLLQLFQHYGQQPDGTSESKQSRAFMRTIDYLLVASLLIKDQQALAKWKCIQRLSLRFFNKLHAYIKFS